ncbi:Allophanate hydrolase subunit 1 [Isosphaera pallida ATCC 43644]|jgi:KipI family sensor histidine kinase inhibitor|uniref:Allophanate hydrolase subunit 1 n=1 Tax=Isosphaera pallida (strain ATCC 43644 / DSM 9630 / IS1B) TaxID=575540 RepID=E8QYT3_ISOPI|nr:carboxyltransferase domain-containing protein [Isosphaera pallida]ADV61059.1 Allophanate hydrolase subunit 1 [Isosphaera pallida ATCC 43644]
MMEPLGERGWLMRFECVERASAFARWVERASWPGVLDVVAAFETVAVLVDPDRIDPAEELPCRLREGLRWIEEGKRVVSVVHHTIPVRYDGPDLEWVADRVGLSPEAVAAAHAAATYRVAAIGFLPGFPYLEPTTPSSPLRAIPRLARPRPRVEVGSVALAGDQTGIYPRVSPGGWRLIGRTPLILADLERDWFRFHVGDSVSFQPIDPDEFQRLRDHPPDPIPRP